MTSVASLGNGSLFFLDLFVPSFASVQKLNHRSSLVRRSHLLSSSTFIFPLRVTLFFWRALARQGPIIESLALQQYNCAAGWSLRTADRLTRGVRLDHSLSLSLSRSSFFFFFYSDRSDSFPFQFEKWLFLTAHPLLSLLGKMKSPRLLVAGRNIFLIL